MTVGRSPACGIALPWDAQVSRSHASIEAIDGVWTVLDDGRSTNGTFVNEERVQGRRKLRHLDVIRVGATRLRFHDPSEALGHEADRGRVRTSPCRRSRRRSCACWRRSAGSADGPATNEEIADELTVSIDTVKTHMRALFDAFHLQASAPYRKRFELVRIADRLRARAAAATALVSRFFALTRPSLGGVKPRVLFVEDETSISGPFSSALTREGFDPVVCGTLAEARAALRDGLAGPRAARPDAARRRRARPRARAARVRVRGADHHAHRARDRARARGRARAGRRRLRRQAVQRRGGGRAHARGAAARPSRPSRSAPRTSRSGRCGSSSARGARSWTVRSWR